MARVTTTTEDLYGTRTDASPQQRSDLRHDVCGFLEFDGTHPLCLAFDGANGEPVMDAKMAGYLRLPQCIAAEEAGK